MTIRVVHQVKKNQSHPQIQSGKNITMIVHFVMELEIVIFVMVKEPGISVVVFTNVAAVTEEDAQIVKVKVKY